MWTAFLLGFMGGLAATPHCLGMCGGFPLHLAKGPGGGKGALRQLLFVGGKTVTCMFLGALAAALGIILLKDTPLRGSATLLRLIAGGLTILFGLLMLGVQAPKIRALQQIPGAGIIQSTLGGLLSSPGPLAALALGIGVGFLPCPLTMGMLAIAAASHDVLTGIILMAGVGLGTTPGLLAVGLFGFGLSRRTSNLGLRIAGLVVAVMGLMIVGRITGVIQAAHPISHTIPSCCQGH